MSKHLLLLLVSAACFGSGCIITAADNRGPHVEFAELKAVTADAAPADRVKAASSALDAKFVEVVTKDDVGAVMVPDPVGGLQVVAGQGVWWLDDLKPLVAEDSAAAKDIDAHVAARDQALAYDNVFNTGSAVITGALAVSAVGLVWLLGFDGGDPAFYVTLGASGGGAALATATFASWYFLQLPHAVDARLAKIDMIEHWNDGVAARYKVKVEKVDGDKLNISAE